MRVILADYGAGNLHSMARALEQPGVALRVEPDPARWLDGAALVLPGVGAFGPAAERLAPVRTRLREALAGGFPALGVCLGLQLLFEASDEGPGAGIGLFAGAVRRLSAPRLPRMGWAPIVARGDDPVVGPGPRWGWFAHSFAADGAVPGAVAWAPVTEPAAGVAPVPAADPVAIALEQFDGTGAPRGLAAAVRRASTWGVQFHPEKSGPAGRRLIARFLDRAAHAKGGAS